MLLGDEGLSRLQNAAVMVVGLGAVGGYALEALARSGIGRLVLVDFDVFDESNINRQILALTSTVGQKKTEVAAAGCWTLIPTVLSKPEICSSMPTPCLSCWTFRLTSWWMPLMRLIPNAV